MLLDVCVIVKDLLIYNIPHLISEDLILISENLVLMDFFYPPYSMQGTIYDFASIWLHYYVNIIPFKLLFIRGISTSTHSVI